MKDEILNSAVADRAEALCAALEALSKHSQPESVRPEATRLKTEFEALKVEAEQHTGLAPYEARLHRAEKELNMLLLQRYEARDLERWEHYTLKCDICRELETLYQGDDSTIRGVLPRLKLLHAHWFRLHSVPREKQAELKARYDAIDRAWHLRLNRYFAELEVARRAAESRKMEIIEACEAIQDSSDWNSSAEQFKNFQAEWKELPGAPQARERELFQRFRSACDHFFNARNAWFKERRTAANQASEAREACCNELDALDLNSGTEQLRRAAEELRRRWRECGNAGRHTDALLQRFNARMDQVYEAMRSRSRQVLDMRAEWANRVENLLNQAETDDANREDAMQQLSREVSTVKHFERIPGPDGIRAEQREEALLRRYRTLANQSRMRRNISALSQAGNQEQSAAERKRCLRLLSELERFAPAAESTGWSAFDLQAAIEANFAGSEVPMTLERLDTIAAEFLETHPAEAEVERFNGALRRAYDKLS